MTFNSTRNTKVNANSRYTNYNGLVIPVQRREAQDQRCVVNFDKSNGTSVFQPASRERHHGFYERARRKENFKGVSESRLPYNHRQTAAEPLISRDEPVVSKSMWKYKKDSNKIPAIKTPKGYYDTSIESGNRYKWHIPKLTSSAVERQSQCSQTGFRKQCDARNSRNDSVYVRRQVPEIPKFHKDVVTTQPLSVGTRNAQHRFAGPSWRIMPRAEFEQRFNKNRSQKSYQWAKQEQTKPRKQSSTTYVSSSSSSSRFFRSCPSCLGVTDSDESDFTSSDDDEGGSDTDDEEDNQIAEDNFGDPANSAVSDQEDSSGGSDPEESDDSLCGEISLSSSIYDEEIMINEEKAFGEVGQFESDEDFDFDGTGGGAPISSDSFTESDEFFRGSDDECANRNTEHDNDIAEQSLEQYDSDGAI